MDAALASANNATLEAQRASVQSDSLTTFADGQGTWKAAVQSQIFRRPPTNFVRSILPQPCDEFKLRRGRRRRGYSISDDFLRGLNVLGLAEGIISLILHGPGKWRALARKRKKK